MKLALVVLALFTSSVVKADVIATAKSDVDEFVKIANFLDEKIRECIQKRLSTVAGDLPTYLTPCMWSSEIYANEYRISYSTTLESSGYLIERAERLLLQGNTSGQELLDYANQLFFWDERIEQLKERESETLGACYDLFIVGLQLPKCCGEFKADGLNPEFCD